MIPEDYEKQVAVVYKNLSGILSANGMGWMDVIKTSVFIVAGKTPEETQNRIVGFRRVRDTVVTPVFEGAVGRGPPASTLLVVSALADPRFLVEVEMEAIQ